MSTDSRKKTIRVNDIIDLVNEAMRDAKMPLNVTLGTTETRPDKDGKEGKMTLEDAYRLGLINVLTDILHRTNRYHGFGYDLEKYPDPNKTIPPPLERYFNKFDD